MVETSLKQEFLAETYPEAIDIGVAWAQNRYTAVMKDFYKECALGCIKVREKFIGRPDENGCIQTAHGMAFFEWKYDWPGKLEQWVESSKDKLTEYGQLPILIDK